MRRCSHDELEIYRRGVENAPGRRAARRRSTSTTTGCPSTRRAYVIPRGAGQRSTPEASRLVAVAAGQPDRRRGAEAGHAFEGQTFEKGSYVVWMAQARRGLADTALSIGVDISSRISILYAPPGGVEPRLPVGRRRGHDPARRSVLAADQRGDEAEPLRRRRARSRPGRPLRARSWTRRRRCGRSTVCSEPASRCSSRSSSFTTADGATLPAGSAIFGGDSATKTMLAATGPRRGAPVAARADREPAVARADRAGAADRGARRCRRPEHLDAPEPRLHGRSGFGRDDQLGAH